MALAVFKATNLWRSYQQEWGDLSMAYQKLAEKVGPELIEKDTKALRKCMSCQSDFMSNHKFNRICLDCKGLYRNRNTDIIIHGESSTDVSEWTLI